MPAWAVRALARVARGDGGQVEQPPRPAAVEVTTGLLSLGEHLYVPVDSAEDIRKISREIREDMDSAKSHDQLTELKKRGDYLCTLAEAPSWEEKFGDEIGAIRRAAKEEDQTTTNHANKVAKKHGWDADYHPWGGGP